MLILRVKMSKKSKNMAFKEDLKHDSLIASFYFTFISYLTFSGITLFSLVCFRVLQKNGCRFAFC